MGGSIACPLLDYKKLSLAHSYRMSVDNRQFLQNVFKTGLFMKEAMLYLHHHFLTTSFPNFHMFDCKVLEKFGSFSLCFVNYQKVTSYKSLWSFREQFRFVEKKNQKNLDYDFDEPGHGFIHTQAVGCDGSHPNKYIWRIFVIFKGILYWV